MLRHGSRLAAAGAGAGAGHGWGPAPQRVVDRMAAVYAEHHERTLAAFRRPLPALPADGTRPDLLVGLGHYSHRSRDQYRVAIARALGAPAAAVRLSVAWRGRFEAERLVGAHKVLGVTVSTEADSGGGGGAGGGGLPDWSPLVKRERLTELCAAIAARKTLSLVELHITRAALPAAGAGAGADSAAGPDGAALVAAVAAELTAAAARDAVLVVHDGRHAECVARWRRIFHRFGVAPSAVDLDATPEFPAAVVDAVTARREAGGGGPGAGPPAAELREAAVVAALAQISRGNAELPCFFVHGRYVGGDAQLEELHRRKSRLRALLLHPESLTSIKTD